MKTVNLGSGGLESKTLEAARYAVSLKIDPHLMENVNIQTYIQECSFDMILRISRVVYEDKLENEKKIVMVEVPCNWWQHFKYDIFPEWLQRVFPVKYENIEKTVVFTRKALYPDAIFGTEFKRVVIKEEIVEEKG